MTTETKHETQARQPTAVVTLTMTAEPDAPPPIVLSEETTRIGRSPGSDLVLRNRFISSTHAEIVRLEGRAVFRDLRSTNGSRIRRNGRLIPVDHQCGHETTLHDGDELLIGEENQPVSLRVTLSSSGGSPVVAGLQSTLVVRPDELAALPERMDRESLLSLQELNASLQGHDSPELVASALGSWMLRRLPGASHAVISLRDPETGHFAALAELGPASSGVPTELARTLEAEILESGNALVFVADPPSSSVEPHVKEGLCAPIVRNGSLVGLAQADRRSDEASGGFGRPELELLAVAAKQAALALDWSRLLERCQATVEQAIGGIVAVIESRDAYLAGHASAVAQLSVRIATKLRLHPEEVARVERAGVLHEIGRFAVPTEILNAPGELTDEQHERIRSAPVIGAALIERFGFLADLVPILRHVHERWDGRGYPDGLAAEQIPLASRIVAVADAFHTMVSHRAHQEALPQDAALATMAEAAGTRFDPHLVGVLEVTLLSSDELWEFDAATNVGRGIELKLVAPSRD